MKVRSDRAKRLPTLAAIEKAVGMEARKWQDKCHEIACKMLDARLVTGVERYGHYYGPVGIRHPRRGFPFHRHGWIETPGGQVVDPTRWTFEQVEPYLYAGPGDDYDAGGQRLAKSKLGPYPAGPQEESKHLTAEQREAGRKIVQLRVSARARQHLAGLTNGQVQDFTINQLFWLANLPLLWWGEHTREIYEAMAKEGYRALVPIDNWRMATNQPLAAHFP